MPSDAFRAGWDAAADLPPITDPVELDHLATLWRPTVAHAPSPASLSACAKGEGACGAAEPDAAGVALTPPAPAAGAPARNNRAPSRRSNPATKNAPDHAGKRAVGGVS